MSGFDNFDYGKLAQGAGKAVKGIVKAVSPEAGPGIDEAGSGLGDILKAAGLELGDGDAAPPPSPKKDAVRDFDRFGLSPKAPPPSRPPPPLEAPADSMPTDRGDRDKAISTLAALGYDGPEIEQILSGPPKSEPARRQPEAEGRTEAATALNKQASARRVQGAPARRVK